MAQIAPGGRVEGTISTGTVEIVNSPRVKGTINLSKIEGTMPSISEIRTSAERDGLAKRDEAKSDSNQNDSRSQK